MKDKNKIQICKSCVMDTSDENITFDRNGICNHCNDFKKVTIKIGFQISLVKLKLKKLLKKFEMKIIMNLIV